jgi:hypothetical protein
MHIIYLLLHEFDLLLILLYNRGDVCKVKFPLARCPRSMRIYWLVSLYLSIICMIFVPFDCPHYGVIFPVMDVLSAIICHANEWALLEGLKV